MKTLVIRARYLPTWADHLPSFMKQPGVETKEAGDLSAVRFVDIGDVRGASFGNVSTAPVACQAATC
jgi:hypothetical protein